MKDKVKVGRKVGGDERQVNTNVPLFGNWTGKLPVNLLNEFVQKQDWEKPNYLFYVKNLKHQCCIVVAKRNTKTALVEKIRFTTPDYYESKQYAKHAAATYVLHRLSSDKSIHTLLPPVMRDCWSKFESLKRDHDPDTVAAHYTCNPFQIMAKIEARDAIKTEKIEPWLEYPTIHIRKDLRERLETMIRSNLESVIIPGVKEDVKYIKQVLIKKGFRLAHIIEALQYNTSLKAALDWLCIHTPEDDLPIAMRPVESNSIVLESHTQNSLGKQYILERLMMSGFSRYKCQTHLNQSDNHEYRALVSLCLDLASITLNQTFEQDINEPLEFQDEERQVMESIYADLYTHESNDLGIKHSVTIEDIGLVEICIPKYSNYPHTIPGIRLSQSLPAYIRLSLIQKVIQASVAFLGSPLIFSIITTLEEQAAIILKNPPSLTSLYPKQASIKFDNSLTQSVKKKRQYIETSLSQKKINDIALQSEFISKIATKEYQKMLNLRRSLPSYEYKSRSLELNQALIICGETGCGKSTQIGQFLLESQLESGNGSECHIICTQPRRISAIALAERVSNERADKVGGQVGYSIRGESKQSSSTKLLFCTTGVLLRMIQDNTKLVGISHVIIDEVHERGVESDFSLILLRDLLQQRKSLKIILMSATIDATAISAYFNCPVIEIPGVTFPVQDHYISDILAMTGHSSTNLAKGKLKPEYQIEDEFDEISGVSTLKLTQSERDPSFRIDYELIAKTVGYICDISNDGAILIFLPGLMEIKKCVTLIRELNQCLTASLEIFPLHSNLTSSEQAAVFKIMQKGKRKVVVSTNIAETSVTINDVVFVIDTGRVKEMKLINNVLSLTEVWASLAACKQRRGRAGRVQKGIAYKLYTQKFAQKYMASHTEPEILRLPLEQLCLQIKSMGIIDVISFLSKALDPPPLQNIQAAEDLLAKVNAVGPDGCLTSLGKHIVQLPTDIHIAKMLVFAAIFHCLDPILTIATCVGGKGPFLSPSEKRSESNAAHSVFSGSKSDHMMIVKAYNEWCEAGKEGISAQWSFCDKNYLSMTTLVAMKAARKQFSDLLVEMGYMSKTHWSQLNSNSLNNKIVKAVILAGLYPNIASVKMPKQLYDQTIGGTISIAAKSKEIKYYTKNDHRVFIHPSSTLFTCEKYSNSVIVYSSKVATSKIFLRDCSEVPAIAFFMLGGQIEMIHGGQTLEIEGIRFRAFPRISALISGMRRLLDMTLDEKVKSPAFNILDSDLGQLVTDLLNNT